MNQLEQYPQIVNERAGDGFKKLYERVKDERERAQDMVVPADCLRMNDDGTFKIVGSDHADEGVSALLDGLGVSASGENESPIYRAYPAAHRHVAQKIRTLNWPYYERMLTEAPDLCATNVNRWFSHDNEGRNFLVRALRPKDGLGPHHIRAVLSDSYFIVPNYEVVLMALKTLEALNVRVDPLRADISEERMYLSFQLPEVSIDASDLMKNYRNPLSGEQDGRIFAGFTIRNSEIGQAKFEVVPRPFAKCCLNCFTLKSDALSRVHLGGKMSSGEVTWSQETMNKLTELIVLQVKDAVERFCSTDYLEALAGRVEGLKGRKLDHPEKAVRNIGRFVNMSDAECDRMVEHFINGGLHDAMGAVQAYTFSAQEAPGADAVYEREDLFEQVLNRVLKGTFDVDRLI